MNFISQVRIQLEKLNNEIGRVPRIGLIEGFKQEVLDAAKLIVQNNLAEVVLIFETRAQVNSVAMDFEYIVIEEQRERAFKYAQAYYKLRNGKDTIEAVRSKIFAAPLFASMMLSEEEIDGIVGGIKYDPAEIIKFNIRANGLVSSRAIASTVNVVSNTKRTVLISDTVFNENPTKEQLHLIGRNAIEFAELFKFGKNTVFPYEESNLLERDKSIEAAKMLEQSLSVKAEAKPNQHEIAFELKNDDVFVFNSLSNALASLLQIEADGTYDISAPIWIGLAKPANIVAKSARKEDVYNMISITALLAQYSARRRR